MNARLPPQTCLVPVTFPALEPCTKQGVFVAGQYSIGKKMSSRARTRLPLNYRKLAKAAFKQALENKFGSHGAASAVRRIDPKTGKVIEEVRSADDIRRSLGPELAARL